MSQPIASTASLPKQLRVINSAVVELGKLERLTPGLQDRSRQGKERLARYRAQKKCDDLAVAKPGDAASPRAKGRRWESALRPERWWGG